MALVLYRWIVVAAAAAASWYVIQLPGEAGAPGFVIYCFLACATAPLKVKLPGVDRSVSLAFAFSFAALTELPARYGLFIVVLSLLYEDLLDSVPTPRWREVVFQVAATSLGAVSAQGIHSMLKGRLGVEQTLSLLSAAAAYYGVQTALSALRMGLECQKSPWRTWQEQFFWMAPLYLLAPLGIDATRRLWAASTYERLFGLGMILLVYSYVKHYFARLHDQQDHARRMDDIRQRTIEALAVAMEIKDGCTAGHLQRVKRHAGRMARKLRLSEGEIRTLELAAVLHDVGKVGVPDYILGKPGRLTEQEFNELTIHTRLGAEIVSAVQFPYPVEEVVLSHHEHWDGSGYPRQLVGGHIPLLARILTVVDCFDALVSERPYRPAMPIPEAVNIMRDQRGRIFDPAILDAFLETLPEATAELRRELDLEQAQARVKMEPRLPVKQTWLTEADSREAALRRRTVEKLNASPEHMVALYEILETLGGDPEVQFGLRTVLDQITRVIPHERAGVFLADGMNYQLLQGRGIPDYCATRLVLPAGNGQLAQAAAARRPIRIAGSPTEASDPMALLYLRGMRHSLAAPLLVQDQLVGTVAFWTSAAEGFTAEQEWFLGLLTNKLAAAVVSARTVEKLREEASTDPLTGLANSRAAFQHLSEEIRRAYRQGSTLAVLFLDVNQLKIINDTYGHGVGDKLLAAVARTVKQHVRGYDFLARMGGDEFLAILPGISEDSLRRKIQSLQQAVAQTQVSAGDIEVGSSVSIGAARYPEDGCSCEELIYCSDQRMYAEKPAGARQGRMAVAV